MVMNSYFWPSTQGTKPPLAIKHLNADRPETMGEKKNHMEE